MTKEQFKKLKVGDKVVVIDNENNYFKLGDIVTVEIINYDELDVQLSNSDIVQILHYDEFDLQQDIDDMYKNNDTIKELTIDQKIEISSQAMKCVDFMVKKGYTLDFEREYKFFYQLILNNITGGAQNG